jgi:Tol biopolymer transport system component
MRLPILPIVISVLLLSAAVYFFFAAPSSHFTLDVPVLTRLADIDGIETEVALAPDGDRYAGVVSGDVWLLTISTNARERVTETPEPESYPAWSPDGKRIMFTRGADTFAYNPETKSEQPFKTNARTLSWSPTGRIAFVRDRALWLADPNGRNEKQIVEPDANPDIDIHSPRFSPDSLHLAFIKSTLNLRGELWTFDITAGSARQLVFDRQSENPMDVGWIENGAKLVYLTNRAGAYALWYVDLQASTIMPLTQPLVLKPLQRIGFAVSQDRIILPRHIVDSNIVRSDNVVIAQTEDLEFDPAVSRDGSLVAFTVQKGNDLEIWTAASDGSNAVFRTVGREPRFAANGFDLVYTHTDLNGNPDIWKVDLRNSESDQITDADEIDATADPSPDGRTVAFSSARGGAISIWTTAMSGGKRLRLNNGGYGPRYSRDGTLILFWHRGALWTMESDGGNLQNVYEGLPDPVIGAWSRTNPAFIVDDEIRTPADTSFSIPGRKLWPGFDVLPDGRWIVSSIDVRDSSFWAVDLKYKEN